MLRKLCNALCAALVVALVAAGSAPAATFGVDFGWGAPSTGAIQQAGAKFGASYESWDLSKDWRRADVDRLHAAGIATVAVWETTATRAGAGYAAGQVDAREARKRATALGMPSTRPIYFAVDYDAAGAAVLPYFQGAMSVLGRSRTGAYADSYVIDYLWARGVVGYAWGTYAWSGDYRSPHACLWQYSNGHRLADGSDVDYDLAYCADYGQWPYGKPQAPPAVRSQVTSWQRALVASQAAYKATGGPALSQRLDWFSAQIGRHPRDAKAASWARALAATWAAWTGHHCAVFEQRADWFSAQLRKARAKYAGV